MSEIYLPSYITCGNVYEPYLPSNLDQSEAPIVLAEVSVNTKYVKNSCVLIKFSEFINFTLLGLNPKLEIIYRLVRRNEHTKDEQILQNWNFEFETPEIIEIANVNTKQPTVLNYCDCLDGVGGERFSYRLEIIEIVTNSVEEYGLTNKSISATVISGAIGYIKNSMPYINQGKIFNPVLPISLSKSEKPITLSKVNIYAERNKEINVLVNFSGFVTSVLREKDFNRLTFRLLKIYSNYNAEIVREWPFKRAFVNDTNIKEPIVYNYCESLKPTRSIFYTYVLQLVEADLSKDSFYDITTKSMNIQVYNGKDENGFF